MKTWVIWLLVIIFVFVVVKLLYFAIVAKSVTTVVKTDIKPTAFKECPNNLLVRPPDGKYWACVDGGWIIKDIQK